MILMFFNQIRFTITYGVPNIVGHLCFNITENGQMIVPDWYNRILHDTKKYGKNKVFQYKKTKQKNSITIWLILV